MEITHRDNLLIQATLHELDRMGIPDLDGQGKEVGAAGETVRKWRSGESRKLNKNSRPGVERFLRRRGVDPSQLVISREIAIGRNGPADLVRQIDDIRAMDVPEEVKVAEMEALAAIWRGYAMARRADAAVAEGRAAEAAENGAAARTQSAPALPQKREPEPEASPQP
jgi:hypothetical protein